MPPTMNQPSTPPAFPRKTALAIATMALVLTAWHWKVQAGAGMDWRSFAAVPRLPFLTRKPTAGGPASKHAPEPDVQGSGSDPARPGDPAHPAPQQTEDDLLIDNAGTLDRFYAGPARLDAHGPKQRHRRALRRFAHHRRPHHRRRPPDAAGALRRRRPGLQPHRQALGLVPALQHRRNRQRLEDRHRRRPHARRRLRPGRRHLRRLRRRPPPTTSSRAPSRTPSSSSTKASPTAATSTSTPPAPKDDPAGKPKDSTGTVSTLDTSKQSGLQFERVTLPPGTHAVSLKVARGSVRLYGVPVRPLRARRAI